jgi:hypothetical protein
MVGRLVQQQHEWRLRSREHAGHCRAQALAARQRARDLQCRAVAEGEPRQRGMGLVRGEFRIEAAQIVENARGRIEQADMLVEHGDAVCAAVDVAARRRELAGDQAKQAGLAGAVGAADRNPLGSADVE